MGNKTSNATNFFLKKFFDILGILSKFMIFLSISVFLWVVIEYLKKIDKLSLLVNVVKEPFMLLFALFSLFNLLFIMFAGVVVIAIFSFEIKNMIYKHKRNKYRILKITKTNYIFIVFGHLIAVFLFFIGNIIELNNFFWDLLINFILFYGILREFFIQIIIYIKKRDLFIYQKNKLKELEKSGYKVKFLKNYIWDYLMGVFIIIFFINLCFNSFLVFMTRIMEHEQDFLLLITVFIILYWVLIAFSMMISIYYLEQDLFHVDFISVLSVSLSIILIFLVFLFYCTDFGFYSIHYIGFVEKSRDSSWYLIHNGNTTSETINGMNFDDIENKKRIFNNKNCNDDWCKDDVSVILEQRQNALFGYMAWNLGDTKVFCPASVDFFDGGDNNQAKSKKCLVIDGKYLQLVSEELLLKD